MPKILIVSADFNFATLLEARLLMEDHEVALAEDGVLGFEKAREWAPRLIILDAALPKMSGYQLVEKLKTPGEVLRPIPIMVVADRARMQYLFRDEDIFCFCVKPVIPAQFLSQVDAAMKSSKVPAGFTGKAVENSRAEPRILLAGVQEFMLAKMQKFFEQKNFVVEIGWDENDVVRKAEQMKPDHIFLQYWEEMNLLNTPRILKKLAQHARIRSIPVVVFCSEGVSRDAALLMPGIEVLSFHTSQDLLEKVERSLGSGMDSQEGRRAVP